MQITLNINKIKTILLYLIVGLPGCCLIFGSVKLRLSLIIALGFIFIYSLLNLRNFNKELIHTFDNLYGKLILFWVGWCFITVVVNYIFLGYSISSGLYYFFFHSILLVLIPYYLAYNTMQKLTIEKTIRYYLYFLITIYCLGIINFIFLHSGIHFLQTFFDYTLVNTRQSTIYSDVFRVKSTFVEPSYFANFICCNLPLCYYLSKNNFRLFKNKYLNLFIKKSLIITSWLLLVSTSSPIFLVLAVIITIIYFFVNINKRRLKKFFIYGTIFSLFASLIMFIFIDNFQIDLNETFLKRILKTLDSLGSIDKLVYLEPSLATRIINYINQFIVFLKNPIFGVGYGNIIPPLEEQFLMSAVPLTFEIRSKLVVGGGIANVTIAWLSLAETGLIGFLLLYTFFIKIIKRTKKILNLIKKQDEFFFINGILWALCIIAIVGFYDGEFAGFVVLLYAFMAGYTPKLIKENNNDK